MATTISQFKMEMRQGGARTNQFRVTLGFPAFVNAGQAVQAGAFLCKAASIPASTVNNISVPFRGRPVNFAGERSFAPWTVSIINDGSFLVRNAFERWSAGISNLDSPAGIIDPSAYQSSMIVDQLDRNDNVLKTYTFNEAYPSEIGPMRLSYEDPNIQEFNVTFYYNSYESAA